MSTAIVWLRRDLRIADNPALLQAVNEHDAVIPVYIYAPDEESPWRPGAASDWWLHRSLQKLEQELTRLHSRLTVRRGPSLLTLRQLIAESGADAVYWNRLYEPATIERDSTIKQALGGDSVTVDSFNAALLWEPWTVQTGARGPYRVFTPFWRACRGREHDHPAVPPADLGLWAPPEWPRSQSLQTLKLLPSIDWYRGMEQAWMPGESGAHQRLDAFCTKLVVRYDSTRNAPAMDGVSRLSPHLHFGELSPRQVWRAVSDRFGGEPLSHKGAETFLREIGWREFAHHVLFHFPQTVEQPAHAKFEAFPWREQGDEQLETWQAGRTGIPLVDAGMRELWHSGWMHNRVRMVVASFLTKNCLVHWLHGARWFWDTLVDADLASNTMGWQWSAGCGFDAAPYFRVFNPVRQGEQFDPGGDYVRRWVPELAALPDQVIHEPWKVDSRDRRGYPAPIVDLDRSRAQALAAYQSVKS